MGSDVLNIVFIILYCIATISAMYLLLFSIASRFARRAEFKPSAINQNIAVLIPAYKEDGVIVDSVMDALEQQYPREHFDVFVAAHKLKHETILTLRGLPIHVIELHAQEGSKAYSLRSLLNHIDEQHYSIALILDADNHMSPNCLNIINDAFAQGVKAVQLHRVAKNQNTTVALFDALTEEINNSIFRKGPSALGLSASTIGSGMAFPFSDLKKIYNIEGITLNPACDREVDFEMMVAGNKIEYIDRAYVFDEKVQHAEIFIKQRTRWMESQLWHIGRFFREMNFKVIFNADFINKLVSNLVPSRMIILGIYTIAIILLSLENLSDDNYISPGGGWWLASFATFVLALVIAIPASFRNRKLLNVFLRFPAMMFYYMKALSGMRPGRKTFEHTPKTFDKK